MTTLSFETKINAPKEKVWDTLWNDSSYRDGQPHSWMVLMQKVIGRREVKFHFFVRTGKACLEPYKQKYPKSR